MLDELLARLREPIADKPVFALSNAWFEIAQLRRKSDWARLRDACNEALASFRPDPRLGLLWAEANSQLLGFKGLAEGVTLIRALRFACSGLETEMDDEMLESICGKLCELMLKVPITEAEDRLFTYTSVLNSAHDPARAAAVEAFVAASRSSFYVSMAADLEILYRALGEFGEDLYLLGRSRYREAVELVRKISAAAENWMRSAADVAPGRGWSFRKPAVPLPPDQPVRKADPALSIYVGIEGLSGECTAAYHRNWIYAQSFRHTIQPPPSDEAHSPHAGQVQIEKPLDRSSPALYRACSIGRRFGAITFDFCRGDDAVRFLRVELYDAAISSITQTAIAGELALPVEQVTFEYARIRWTYTEYGPGEAPQGSVCTSDDGRP